MSDLGRRLRRLFEPGRGQGVSTPEPTGSPPTAPGTSGRRDREALRGEPVTVRRWLDLADRNLRFTVDALGAAGIEHWLVDAPLNGPRQLAIDADDAAAALAALRRAAGDSAIYLADSAAPRGRTAPVLIADAQPTSNSWKVFSVALTPDGLPLAAADAAAELQVWTRTTPESEPLGNHELFAVGSLLAPGFTNRWTHVLPADESDFTTVTVGDRTLPTPPVTQTRQVFEPTMPIDAVYTWVDGADPAWVGRKNAAADSGARHPLAENASRFESHDELRYSLRSLEFYADWINHVWLVTDRQLPSWLNQDNPRITVVDHRDIFADPTVLPVFNSHAIESQLHHIDGLSEHFVYLNDDVMFTAPAQPEQYVLANGLTLFQPSRLTIGTGAVRDSDTPVVAAGKRTDEVLRRLAGVTVTNRLQHCPMALRRSVLTELEQRLPDEFARTAAARFRSPSDLSVASSLAHYYAFLTQRAVPGRLRARYVDIANPDAQGKLDALLLARNYDVLCLNDTASEALDDADRTRLVDDFLSAYFPYPSSFERPQ